MSRLWTTLSQPDPLRVGEDDLGHHLGFFGLLPWLLFALAVAQVVYVPLVVIGTARLPVAEVLCLVALIAACSLIVIPAPTPLPRWRTLVILAVIVVSILVTIDEPYVRSPPGTANWMLNPCDLLLFWLVIRGRFLAGWIGQALIQSIFAIWSIVLTGGPWWGLMQSHGQILPLVAVTLFAVGLHRTVARIVEHRNLERERADREARAAAEDAHTESALREIRALAGPTLEAMAAGEMPDERRVRGLEAALRDMIRGRALVREPLTTRLRRSREEGMDIVVLDDSGETDLPDEVLDHLAGWAAQQVADTPGSEMTLRLTVDGDTALLTATVDGQPLGEERSALLPTAEDADANHGTVAHREPKEPNAVGGESDGPRNWGFPVTRD